MPGQPGCRGTMTVLNRTTAPVTISSGEGGQIEMTVAACDGGTRDDFPINFCELTSPGRDTFHSGGGVSVPRSILVVTDVVTFHDVRPDPLPPCEGLLQPAQH